jgi:pyruvate-formate lyase
MVNEHNIAAALRLEPRPAPWEKPLSLELALTDCYKTLRDARPAAREAAFLRIQLPAMMTPMRDGDVFAGRVRYPLVGLSPELMGVGYYCLEKPIREILANPAAALDDTARARIGDMLAFWKNETTHAKIRAAYPDDVRRVLPEDDWPRHPGAAFPLYRMAGITLDNEKLLRLGLPGLAARLREKPGQSAGQPAPLVENTLAVLELLADLSRRYAAEARALGQAETAAALDAIALREPRTLREAIQLFWLVTLAAGVCNYGRMDVWLGPFLARDLDSGALTRDAALSLLRALWRHIADSHDNMFNNRICVGGLGRPDEACADQFALLAIEATRTVALNQPQLSLRFHRRQNPALMQAALASIGEGRTFPILYNDDVNIPAVAAAFNISRDEALSYFPYGCGEYILDHASTGTPNGLINLLKILEDTLNQPAPDGATPDERFPTFETLWNAYAAQVETTVAALARQEKITYEGAGAAAPFLLISALFDDCAARGQPVFSGGARRLGGTLESYGNTNTADSLTAIRRLVYRERSCTLGEIVRACRDNFASPDSARLRRRLLDAPKFGNDDDEADSLAARVHEQACAAARDAGPRAGFDHYHLVIINNGANTVLGAHTAASPDGRAAGEPMANAINPSPGLDRNGTTAFLNSLLKIRPDIHAGSVQNMKFARSLFSPASLPKTAALLSAWFDAGGTQAMITVVNRGDLEAAMREPEKWGHLIVRVGGFSMRFVELSRDTQLEIIGRTLNE